MYLTSEHLVGSKTTTTGAMRDDLSFIVRYDWPSSQHMKEAIKILLSARLDGAKRDSYVRFEGDMNQAHKEVQLRLASNPHTTEEVLDYLRKNASPKVCERLAGNPRSSEQTLTALAKHQDATVRSALSENPVCPITVLYDLTNDQHPDVRYCMAENPNLPISITEELSHDENPFVAARAQETLYRATCGTVIEGKFEQFAIPQLRIATTA